MWRSNALRDYAKNRFDSPGHRAFQRLLATMTPEQKEIVRDTVQYCVDGAMNDFLFYLDKELRRKKPTLRLEAGGVSVTEQTANLQKELYGPTGWKVRFSQFKENNGEIAVGSPLKDALVGALFSGHVGWTNTTGSQTTSLLGLESRATIVARFSKPSERSTP